MSKTSSQLEVDVWVQDDLTGLTLHRVIAAGQITQGE